MRPFKLFFGLLIFLPIITLQSEAKIIESETLLAKVIRSYEEVFQFNIDTKVSVFDPEAFQPLEESSEEDVHPYELVDKGFLQKIAFVRDEYSLIETHDSYQQPLHLYIYEDHRELNTNYDETRKFNNGDVYYPHLIFYTKFKRILREHLHQMGIPTKQVAIKQHNNSIVYQLGSDSENILVDPNHFNIIEINRLIQFRGRYFPLKTVFSNWDKTKHRIPRTTRYYVNSRLFKLCEVTFIGFRGIRTRKNDIHKRMKFGLSANEPLKSIEFSQ